VRSSLARRDWLRGRTVERRDRLLPLRLRRLCSLAVVEAKRASRSPRDADEQLRHYVTEIAKRQPYAPFGFMANGREIWFWEVGMANPRLIAGFFTPEDLQRMLFLRQHAHPKAFPPDKMGAPPPEMARRNPANPAGISYLHVAKEEPTAVAEIRTFVGAKISLCRARPKKNLKVADLTKQHMVGSPFGHKNLQSIVKRNALLNVLNEELARPVNPEDGEVEYVPTQYLAEVILNAGYDGIRYKSAVRPGGINFVFFQPDDLEIQPDTRLVEVRSIVVDYR
jgi:hypothetical protein